MFDKKFLQEQETKLLKQKVDLESQLKDLRSKKRRGFPFNVRFPRLGSDVDSDVQEIEQYEGNLSLEKQLADQLRDIKYALSMMKRGRYGHCLACGKEIEIDRLRTLPAALTHTNHARPVRFWQRITIWPFKKNNKQLTNKPKIKKQNKK
ncbi:MAG: TraR/DksA C4-type zinc finger protein [Patescibacteria group bacterium]|nr:TraR/DksA C4-type zinc finger protein [Patescibacteria group bacterium]